MQGALTDSSYRCIMTRVFTRELIYLFQSDSKGLTNNYITVLLRRARDGAVAGALASHQCGPGSNSTYA